jgi:hypothetical protein
MQRDMALVKKILKYVEDETPSTRTFVAYPEFREFTAEQVAYHVMLCAKSRFIEVSDGRLIVDLTWAGHDLLAQWRQRES